MSKKCRNCGTLLPDDSIFCTKCGSKDIYNDDINDRYCQYCGRKIPTDSEFCVYCGRTLNENVIKPHVDIVDQEQKTTNSISQQEKKKINPFKLVLSWIVMVLIFFIALFIFSLLIDLGRTILDAVSEWPLIIKVVAFCLGGATTLFGLIIAPIWYGIPALVAISESICESPKGTRYVVFGVFIAIDYLLSFILNLINYHSFSMTHLIIGIAGIALAFFRNRLFKNN